MKLRICTTWSVLISWAGLCSSVTSPMITPIPNCSPTYSPTSSLQSGLVLYLPFDGIAVNEGMESHAINAIDVSYVQDRFLNTAKSVRFNANGNYVSVTDSYGSNLQIGVNSFTISAWIQMSVLTTGRIFSHESGDCSTPGYQLTIISGVIMIKYFCNGGGSCLVESRFSTTTLVISTWYLITVIVDNSGFISIFINGALDSSFDTTITCDVSAASGVTALIGARDTIGTEQFLGKIDE
jgi:hypothetical protein